MSSEAISLIYYCRSHLRYRGHSPNFVVFYVWCLFGSVMEYCRNNKGPAVSVYCLHVRAVDVFLYAIMELEVAPSW